MFQFFFVLLQTIPVSVSVVGTWCESVRTMQVGHMFNFMVFMYEITKSDSAFSVCFDYG